MKQNERKYAQNNLDRPLWSVVGQMETPIFDHESYRQLWKINISSLRSPVYLCIHAINNHRLSTMLRARGENVFVFRELWSDGRGKKR